MTSTEERSPNASPTTARERLAVSVAAAAITLALGLGATSLLGGPAPVDAPIAGGASDAPIEPVTTEPVTTERVVLVPIAPSAPTGEGSGGASDDGERSWREREHEDDDDEHDDDDDDDDGDDDDRWRAFARGEDADE